jgi:ribose transport system ATP-binding protein
MYDKTTEALKRLGCKFDAKELVANLSISEKQMVEIARALVFDAKVVFFDEPTSSIMHHEKEMLFKNIRMLKKQGIGIVYITHKLDEVFELTERVIVFRDGKRVGTVKTKETNIDEITELMIGRAINEYFHKNKAKPGKEILRVEGLSSKGAFENVSFSVRQGEVVGFYGLVGSGRTEVVETIFGVRKAAAGKVFFDGKEITHLNSKNSTDIGIGLVPEDRKGCGCVLGMSCLHNISLVTLPMIKKGLFLNRKAEMNIYNMYKERFDIKTPSAHQLMRNLSGGNQQKIILAKWMAINAKLLILDEPTRGIDVGTKSEIHNLIAELAGSGLAVIVISSEMPEIIGVSNRVYIMRSGKLVGGIDEEEGITENALISKVIV